MKTEGTVPVHGSSYGPVQFPIGADDDLADVRADALAGPAPIPTRVDRWRTDNPNAFSTWETKHGCVVQFWGVRVYYGRCRDCPALVTARRSISGAYVPKYKDGPTQLGRWPMLCADCRRRKYAEHAAGARYRMAALRRKRYGFRGEQYAKAGLPTPRQGVPGEGARLEQARRDEERWEYERGL